jgi:hypothetical protein
MQLTDIKGYYVFYLILGLFCASFIGSSYGDKEFLLGLAIFSPVLSVFAIFCSIFCVQSLFVKPREWPMVCLGVSTLSFFALAFLGYGMALWIFGMPGLIEGFSEEHMQPISIAYSAGTVALATWGIIR